MNVTLLSIGDELLTGRTVNTNAAWLGQQLASVGHPVGTVLTLGDDRALINKAIADAAAVSDLVVVTGGLGPTDDDITREAVCDLLSCEMQISEEQHNLIEKRFAAIGRTPNERTWRQARVPSKCTVIPNHWGTAPGLHFSFGKATVVVLPGVPAEMRELFTIALRDLVRPAEGFCERVWLLYGVPESVLAERLEPLDEFFSDELGLAYLPAEGTIRLRLVRTSTTPETLERFAAASQRIEELAGKWIVSCRNEALWEAVGRELLERGATVATAESCTAGMISAHLTNLPGSSGYYPGGIIGYANEVKVNLLGVQGQTIDAHGAVSEAVVLEMARGVRRVVGADYGLAVTGIAGPGGATPTKPVGTVWVAVASENNAVARLLQLKGERDVIRRYTVNAALSMLLNCVRDEFQA